MDLITQAALGATVGQVGFQRKLGKKALFWGAILGALPDIDVLVQLLDDPYATMLYHRGFTHSILFGLIFGPFFGWLLFKYYSLKAHTDRREIWPWIGLSFWALITHPLLDWFTVYGTMLLAPFSDFRFYLPSVAIIDPVYTIALFIAILVGIICHKRPRVYISAAAIALTFSSGYLLYGLQLNDEAEKIATHQLAKEENIHCANVKGYTTLYQLFLRRLVVQLPDEVRVGFYSSLNPQPIEWHRFKKAPFSLTKTFLESREAKIFRWFAADQYLIQNTPQDNKHLLKMYDLRFGLMDESILGIWGIQALVTEEGHLINEPKKFSVYDYTRRIPSPLAIFALVMGPSQKEKTP